MLPDDVELWIFLIDWPDRSSVRISQDFERKLALSSSYKTNRFTEIEFAAAESSHFVCIFLVWLTVDIIDDVIS